jgi:hypothetical protein
MNSLIQWVLASVITLWRFKSPPRLQLPKWELTWECECSFSLSHTPMLPSWPTSLQALALITSLRLGLWHRTSHQVLGVMHLVCAALDWHCHKKHGCFGPRWVVDRSHLQVVRAPMSLGEAHYGYERWDLPKENKLVGATRRHIQVLHLVSVPICRAHKCPCAFQVIVDQVVDDHVRRHASDQRD